MRHKLATAIALASALPAATQAQTTPNPALGAWAVDVTKLPVPPEARPRSVTMTFSEAGAGQYRTNVDIVLADGAESHGHATYTPDGSASPVVDSPEADVGAVLMPVPGVVVMVLGKDGHGGSTRVYTVAPDGQSMIETATYYRQDGTPVMRTNYFTRAR